MQALPTYSSHLAGFRVCNDEDLFTPWISGSLTAHAEAGSRDRGRIWRNCCFEQTAPSFGAYLLHRICAILARAPSNAGQSTALSASLRNHTVIMRVIFWLHREAQCLRKSDLVQTAGAA